MNSTVVRFAPSPTGPLHIGGARTAIFNVMFAMKNNGTCILRIDDTDKTRSNDKYINDIINSLNWLGLVFQETYRQSERFEIYDEMIEQLIKKGMIYSQKSEKGEALIFKAEKKPICFNDIIRGAISIDATEIEDFVVRKSDGTPTYLFASVIDDIDMGVTHIIRGEDHISNTFRQILLFEAITPSYIPAFAHLPLIQSMDGAKLSKREGAISVLDFKMEGFLPEALLNTLFLLGWSPGGEEEILNFKEASKRFSLKNVSKNAAKFSYEKALWINSQYIKKASPHEIIKACKDIGVKEILHYESADKQKLLEAIELTKSRPRRVIDFVKCISFFFEPHIHIKQEIRDKYLSDKLSLVPLLEDIKKIIIETNPFKKDIIEKRLRSLCQSKGLKAKDVFVPLRVVLTGQDVTPGIFDVIELMGKHLCIKRLIDFLYQNKE